MGKKETLSEQKIYRHPAYNTKQRTKEWKKTKKTKNKNAAECMYMCECVHVKIAYLSRFGLKCNRKPPACQMPCHADTCKSLHLSMYGHFLLSQND